MRDNALIVAGMGAVALAGAMWVFSATAMLGGETAAPAAASKPPITPAGEATATQALATEAASAPSTTAADGATLPQPPATTSRIGSVPDDLIAKRLTLPVPSVKAENLTPQFYDARGERGHEALDIMAPRGDPVVAVEDGTIAKLFESKGGGLTIYQFDPTETYTYYYAHLDRYADGLKEGDLVMRGQVIGYVGFTGNANPAAPHLHFGIFRLGPEKQWWKGEALDPYPALVREAG